MNFAKYNLQDGLRVKTFFSRMGLTILLLFLLKIVGMIVFGAVVGIVDPSLFDIVTNQQEINVQKLAAKTTYWLFVVALLAPVIEELIFRGFIDKTKKGILFTVLGLSAYAVNTVLAELDFSKDHNIILSGLWVVSGVVVILRNVEKTPVFKASTSWLIILSSLAFALIHIDNFSDVDINWYQKVLLTIPQFFMGLAFGIVRIKFSMTHSVLGHVFNNSFAFL